MYFSHPFGSTGAKRTSLFLFKFEVFLLSEVPSHLQLSTTSMNKENDLIIEGFFLESGLLKGKKKNPNQKTAQALSVLKSGIMGNAAAKISIA